MAGDLRTLTEPVPGDQSSDRRHRFEALVSSTTPWGFRLSGRLRWRSGLPYSVVRTVVEPIDGDRVRIAWVLPEGRNTRRGPSQWLADLRWTKELRVGQRSAARMYVDVFNLLDDRTVAVHDPWTGRGRSLDGFREAVGETGRRVLVGVAWSM